MKGEPGEPGTTGHRGEDGAIGLKGQKGDRSTGILGHPGPKGQKVESVLCTLCSLILNALAVVTYNAYMLSSHRESLYLDVKERRGMLDYLVHQVISGQEDLRETLEPLDMQVNTNLLSTVIASALRMTFVHVVLFYFLFFSMCLFQGPQEHLVSQAHMVPLDLLDLQAQMEIKVHVCLHCRLFTTCHQF